MCFVKIYYYYYYYQFFRRIRVTQKARQPVQGGPLASTQIQHTERTTIFSFIICDILISSCLVCTHLYIYSRLENNIYKAAT